MRNTTRILFWMCLFLATIIAIALLFLPALQAAFEANEIFNSMILSVFVLGVVINFRQVIGLNKETAWIEAFRDDSLDEARQPVMLAPMARMLTGRAGEGFSLSAVSMRTLMDGIRARLDESRDLSRYIIGLLIFLGLLGTFWGLLATLRSVGLVIDNISVEAGEDIGAMFSKLKAGLQQPLYGMGTAFSSSLFGLAGSLILGFTDLQAGHAQTRFANELEEWLSGLTRLSSGQLLGSDGEQSAAGYTQALLEQTAENLDKLQRTLARSEEERRNVGNSLQLLTQQITNLTEQIQSEQKLIMNMAKRQGELQPVLSALADGASGAWGTNEEAQQQLRKLNANLGRLLEESIASRTHITEELRKEIRLLSRTVAQTIGSRETDKDIGKDSS